MTSDQLKNLMKVLDSGTIPSMDDSRRVPSRDWRRENVHTSQKVSVRSLVQSGQEYGQGD